jgi:predicted Holliday junction resolvase-like endonuclease
MNILRLLGEILLIYILYKLVFDFIIPVYQTAKRVKKQFGEMQNKMHEQMNAYNQQQNSQASKPKQETTKNEEYIDYEEIK